MTQREWPGTAAVLCAASASLHTAAVPDHAPLAYTPRMAEGFRTFDHTGDLGLEVWAETPERLYALAAEALLAQLIECPPGPPELRLELELEGADPADLLVHWLNTALLEAETRGAAWTGARVQRLGARSLEAVLEGQRRDPARQVFLREVKAVSHHFLELDLAPPDCRCRVVLDI